MGIPLSKYRWNENSFDILLHYIYTFTDIPKKFDRKEEIAELRRNFSSPIKNELNNGELKILDIRCRQISKINFLLADITDELPYNDKSFDFIHIRDLVFDLRDKQRDSFIRECLRITEPKFGAKNVGPDLEKLEKN
ncbi:6920_t:CDS:2, partial [Dentiscutata heterogama]